MRLYLIGLPKSGKTYVAKELASKLNLKAIDMYEYISMDAYMYPEELKVAYGDAFYNDYIKNTFNKLTEEDNIVIASVYDAVSDKIDFKKVDKVIYLKPDFNVLASRMTDEENDELPEKYLRYKDIYDSVSDITLIDDDINKIIKEL